MLRKTILILLVLVAIFGFAIDIEAGCGGSGNGLFSRFRSRLPFARSARRAEAAGYLQYATTYSYSSPAIVLPTASRMPGCACVNCQCGQVPQAVPMQLPVGPAFQPAAALLPRAAFRSNGDCPNGQCPAYR